MEGLEKPIKAGSVLVHTTENDGHSSEALAAMAMDKIVRISGEMPREIADQVNAYKDNLRSILIFYMDAAKSSQRTTIIALLEKHGEHVIADQLRRM